MNVTTTLHLTSDELQAIVSQAVAPYADAVRSLEVKVGTRKHAYTVAETAEMIGYCDRKIIEFIKKGRKDKKGLMRRLPHLEVTAGQYRIRPHDLDTWLSHF